MHLCTLACLCNVIMFSCRRDERWLVCPICCWFMVDVLIYSLCSSLLKSYFCVSLLISCSTFDSRIPTTPGKELSNLLSIVIFVAKTMCRVYYVSSPIENLASSYCNGISVMHSLMYYRKIRIVRTTKCLKLLKLTFFQRPRQMGITFDWVNFNLHVIHKIIRRR
jgi:hypothetical protein